MSPTPALPPVDHQEVSLPLDFPLPVVTGVWSLVGQGIRLWFANLKALAAIVAVVWFPIDLLQSYFIYALEQQENIGLMFRLASLEEAIFGTLVAPSLIYANIIYLRENRSAGLGEAYRWGVKKWGSTLGNRVRAGIYIMIGLILLIVPGIYFWTKYALTDEVVAIEGDSIGGALERSEDLTEGARLRIFGTGIAGMCIIFFAAFFVSLPLAFVDTWWISAMVDMVLAVWLAVVPCTLTVFYLDQVRRARLQSAGAANP